MPGRVGHEKASQFALLNCTQPGRGKSQAIEHNRALPKVSQSLRKASLCGLPLRALRVRVMVGYVWRPSPDNSYLGLRLFSQAAPWWRGPLPRWRAQALAGVAGGQFVATPSPLGRCIIARCIKGADEMRETILILQLAIVSSEALALA
jgi:hypothetical protein